MDYSNISFQAFINNLLKNQNLNEEIKDYDEKNPNELFTELMKYKIKLQHYLNIYKNNQYFRSCYLLDIPYLIKNLDSKNASKIAIKYYYCLSALNNKEKRKEIFMEKKQKKEEKEICMYCDSILNDDHCCDVCGEDKRSYEAEQVQSECSRYNFRTNKEHDITRENIVVDNAVNYTIEEVKNIQLNENDLLNQPLSFNKLENEEVTIRINCNFTKESIENVDDLGNNVVKEHGTMSVEKTIGLQGTMNVEAKMNDKSSFLTKDIESIINEDNLSDNVDYVKELREDKLICNVTCHECDSGVNTKWICGVCTFINEFSLINCAVCNTNKNEDKYKEEFLKTNVFEDNQETIITEECILEKKIKKYDDIDSTNCDIQLSRKTCDDATSNYEEYNNNNINNNNNNINNNNNFKNNNNNSNNNNINSNNNNSNNNNSNNNNSNNNNSNNNNNNNNSNNIITNKDKLGYNEDIAENNDKILSEYTCDTFNVLRCNKESIIITSDTWKCMKCTYENSSKVSDCEVCFSEAPHKYKWECRNCKMMNDDNISQCIKCGRINERNMKNDIFDPEGKYQRCWYRRCRSIVTDSKYCLQCGLDQMGLKTPESFVFRKMGNAGSLQQVWICTSCQHLTDAIYDRCERCGNSIFNKGKRICRDCKWVSSINSRLCIKCKN